VNSRKAGSPNLDERVKFQLNPCRRSSPLAYAPSVAGVNEAQICYFIIVSFAAGWTSFGTRLGKRRVPRPKHSERKLLGLAKPSGMLITMGPAPSIGYDLRTMCC
jgi:hypothetical protein